MTDLQLEDLQMGNSHDNIKKIVLLVEDDPDQRENLEKTANRYFGEDPSVGVYVAENTTKALVGLQKYLKNSSNALLYAILDYNMGLNEAGRKKPTETLFYHQNFQHYLKNGGVVVIYSGYPEQVKQSSEIFNTPRKYDNVAFITAEKSNVITEDIFRLLKNTGSEKIPHLRTAAEKYKFDLGKIIEAIRNRKS
ncbi:MAG: response regulator [Desulfobacteraceae bacterium]|nr:response regulator [Desulfobacteraceae bacterium]